MRDEVLSARRVRNAEWGDEFLNDPQAQRDLRFRWTGQTIEDGASQPPLEYFYPSAVGSSIFYYGDFEPGEIAFAAEVLAGVDAPVIFDVGANIGVHAVTWCSQLSGATVHAFEPVPKNLDVLERNVAANVMTDRIIVNGCALDRTSGVATLYEARDAAYSSLVARDDTVVETYDVPTLRLDDYVAQRALARVDLIKIDVEGMQDAVLEGAVETIARDAPFLLVEISNEGTSVKRLLDLGYRAYVIDQGIVTPYDLRDDDLYDNHFFVHERRAAEFRLPATNAQFARSESSRRLRRNRALREALDVFRMQVREKDEEIHRLKNSAEERLALLQRLEREYHELRASDQRATLITELQRTLVDQRAEIDRQRVAAVERLELAQRLEQSVISLRAALAEQREELEHQRRAAAERLELIERFEERHAGMVAELELQRNAAAERLAVIEMLEEQRTSLAE